MDKNDILIGFIAGLIIGIMTLGGIMLKYPESTRIANDLLNSEKYKIDTIMIVQGNDTSYNYKFKKIK